MSESTWKEQDLRRYYGKYPGLVTDPDPEGGEHRGVIQVDVPGILEEDGRGGSRPLRVLARPCFIPGFFYIPQKGQPVWVEFAAGNIDEPLWTGVWYPTAGDAAMKPPKTGTGDPPHTQQLVIRLGSRVLHLDEEKGSIRVVDEQNDSRVEMDGNGIRMEYRKHAIRIQGDKIDIVADDTMPPGTPTARGEVNLQGTLAVTAYGQPLVLAPFVDRLLTLLLSHMHIGNLGAPTPLDPATMASIISLRTELELPVPEPSLPTLLSRTFLKV